MLFHDFDRRSFGQVQAHCKKKCKLRFLFISLKTMETFKVLTSKIAYDLRMCYEPRVSCARSLFKKKNYSCLGHFLYSLFMCIFNKLMPCYGLPFKWHAMRFKWMLWDLYDIMWNIKMKALMLWYAVVWYNVIWYVMRLDQKRPHKQKYSKHFEVK